MKTQTHFINRLLFTVFAAIGLFNMAVQTAKAQAIDYAEIWVTPYGTNSGTFTGSGTITDPFCTPDPDSFHSLFYPTGFTWSTNLVVHLMPGVFHVRADSTTRFCIQAKNDWKIRGSGMDVTVLQLMTNHASSGGQKLAMVYADSISGVEVSDLTIDCNLQNQNQNQCINGVELHGSDEIINHCRAINWGSTISGAECFVFIINGRDNYPDTGGVIENCIVEQPAPVMNAANTTAFDCGSGGDNPVQAEGWVIRGCTVRNIPSVFNNDIHGFTVDGRGVEVCNNLALNLTNWYAMYEDSYNLQDIYVHDNQFLNSHCGVYFSSAGYTYTNLVFANNIITCANGGDGFIIGSDGPLLNCQAIRIEGNVVKPHEQGDLCIPLWIGTSLPGGFQLSCDNNIFDSGTNGDPGSLYNDIGSDGNGTNYLFMNILSFKNNHNLRGTPLTMGPYQTWDYQLTGDYDEDLSFTPATSGWYKIFSSVASYTSPASGRINIWSKDVNNTGNDVDLGIDFELLATGYGILNQTYNDGQNDWSLIPQVRLAAYTGGTEEGFEIYVASALVGQKISLHVSGLHRPPLGTTGNGTTVYCSGPAPSTQTVNATASVVLNIGAGISISGGITGGTITGNGSGLTGLNASQITSGTIPAAQLPIIPPGNGGLGLNASTWAAGLIPYTTATGTFSSTPIGSFGLNLLNSATQSAALTTLGLPGNPQVILTTTNIGTYLFTNDVNLTSLGLGGNAYLTFTNDGYPSFGFSSSPIIQGGLSDAFGWMALASSTTNCAGNDAFGYETLQSFTNGFGNVAFGGNTLKNEANGSWNTAVGYGSLANAPGTSDSTALGAGALQQEITGQNNTALGYGALQNVTNGNYNIAIGSSAAVNLTTGSYNIDIGNFGLSTDTGVIRIGSSSQTDTYLAGVIHAPNNVIVAGILTVSNGIASTLSNSLPAVAVSVGTSPYFWTNQTPQNLAVYVNGVNGSVGYNGTLLFGPISGAPVTVILQPGSYVSITNSTGTPVLNWHPM